MITNCQQCGVPLKKFERKYCSKHWHERQIMNSRVYWVKHYGGKVHPVEYANEPVKCCTCGQEYHPVKDRPRGGRKNMRVCHECLRKRHNDNVRKYYDHNKKMNPLSGSQCHISKSSMVAGQRVKRQIKAVNMKTIAHTTGPKLLRVFERIIADPSLYHRMGDGV